MITDKHHFILLNYGKFSLMKINAIYQIYPLLYNFRFQRDDTNYVKVQYKNWSTDPEWTPKADEPPIEIFKIENEIQVLPEGTPDVVEADFERKVMLQSIEENIEKLKKYLSYDQYTWWKTFLDDPQSQLPTAASWDWPLSSLAAQVQDSLLDNSYVIDEAMAAISPMAVLMEKERRIPIVYTGSKKNTTKKNRAPEPAVQQQIEVGYMIGFEEEAEFRIGKVVSSDDEYVTVVLYMGTINDIWEPAVANGGRHHHKKVEKKTIKEDLIFYLTKSGRLPSCIKEKVQQLF